MICDHRGSDGRKMDTWLKGDAEVCARCVAGVGISQPIKMRGWLVQVNFAEVEMLAMTAMMQEVGIEFVGGEAMGTAEQFEEFKRRWTVKYPNRSFAAKYGEKGEGV